MIYNVVLQNSSTFTVDDQELALWLMIEQKSGLTFGEIEAMRGKGSLTANAWIMFCGAIRQGKTELMKLETWLEHEFDDFDIEDDSPKESTSDPSSSD